MARRIAASSIQWSAMAERCPPTQKANFLAFKGKSDNYLRKVLANPAELPKIDWAYYKKSIPLASMVDNFQKQYEALNIPYPPDTVSSQLDAKTKEIEDRIAKFKKESAAHIASYEKQLAQLATLLPMSVMTMEDHYDYHPEERMGPNDIKTFWPHNPAEDVPPTPEQLEAARKADDDH